MSRLTTEQMNELAEYLRGSAGSLSGALDVLFGIDEADFVLEDCYKLDARIFECEDCGWWCGEDERSFVKDDVCAECTS